MEPARGRFQFRLVDLFLLILVAALLLGLLLPSIQAAREAARRASCIGTLKMHGLAFHNYHDAFRCFPPSCGVTRAPDGSIAALDGWSWLVPLLPYQEYCSLYDSLDTPPLEARLAEFPGVTSILVKDLDTGETIYESNVDYVLSGMSIVKIGIMVEVYRHYGGEVDEQTHQELLDMLGSESCNPCANRLMATVGGGSSYDGAAKVTNTMRRLGLKNFYICAPFRVVELWGEDEQLGLAHGDQLIWARGTGLWLVQDQTPRYDRCVRATPREMANLVKMIYQCTQDSGLLRDAYPNVFSPETCQEMIDIMAANDLRNMLGAGIPAEVKLAHKHGFSGYGVSWGDTRGEVGIVFSPGADWLISFYIWEDTPWINWGINQPLYRDVSNMLYNYFNVNEPFWPLPPWAPPPEEETSESDT